jgi:hypothetical protein
MPSTATISKAIHMRHQDLNLKRARVWIRRLKSGLSVEHPIAGDVHSSPNSRQVESWGDPLTHNLFEARSAMRYN